MVLGGDGYGTRQDGEEAVGSRRREPVGRLLRTRAVVAVVAAAACLSALVVLAGQARDGGVANRDAVVLEEEIGSFGTALNQRQVENADAEFDDTFQDDPGHVSRGEIRFEAALRAAGGRNPAERRRRPRFEMQRRPNLRAQWTAVPEEDQRPSSKVAVNIVAAAPAPAAPSRLGMSDKAARNDLNSYFSSLASQVQEQEKVHAERVLGELSGSSGSSADSASTSTSTSTRQSLGAMARSHGQEVADQKVSALMKLVKKAAASKKFQEALVTASRDTYRGSVVGDFE